MNGKLLVELLPGSPASVMQGCTCDAEDNCDGQGVELDGKPMYFVAVDCPLHGEGRTYDKIAVNDGSSGDGRHL